MLRRVKLSPLSISRHWTFEKTHQHYVKLTDDFPQEFLSEKLLSVLEKCTFNKQIQQVHTQMLLNSTYKPNFLLSKIIDLKDYPYASLVFSHIPEPNDYAFNVMIRGLTTTWKKYTLAIEFYYQMKSLGLKPNNFTYPFVFIACGNLELINHGRTGHSLVFKIGLDNDGHVSHCLVTMYARNGELEYARKVFDEISERDIVSWNSMISAYSKKGCAQNAVELFWGMRDAGFEPDNMTLVSVLVACGDLGDISLGRWIEKLVVLNQMELNSYLGSALIGMYGKCGDLLSARRLFDRMKGKDRVTWNAIITSYAQNGMADQAVMLFDNMKMAGVEPDQITLIAILSACASVGALGTGKGIEKYASQRGLQNDIYVATALIDMYSKCGSLNNALRVFEDMPHKNEVSWNAMISGLAFNGRAMEAISLFKRMMEDGVAARPNDITFVGVLSACVHAGLVDEGRQLFNMMISTFDLVPKIEHYSCMVDLLARAGHIYEAWNLVEKMPGKPDEILLGALLGACQKCKNVDLTERIMQILLELEPSNSGNYVISSKIYANSNRWDESARMRLLMRQRGVSKTPGCSWIEVKNQLHEFHSGDDFYHLSMITEIDLVFWMLNEDLKREGYVPNTNLL